MSEKFRRYDSSSQRFSLAPAAVTERSRMVTDPVTTTTFNAGDIIPIRCIEVLPSQELAISVDCVVRQMTVVKPTMGEMEIDIYAFEVPNRVVNSGFKAMQGENVSGSWIAPDVVLAPLYGSFTSSSSPYPDEVEIPVGSVADYYGLPTQSAFPASVLRRMHDLKFRGYLAIYNEYFRDQNYQPPVPFSTLNVYNGFLEPLDDPAVNSTSIAYSPYVSIRNGVTTVPVGQPGDDSVGAGAIRAALDSGASGRLNVALDIYARHCPWRATMKPFKANKRHDYFTSVLPSPLKHAAVSFPLAGSAAVDFDFAPAASHYDNATYGLKYLFQNSSPGAASGVRSLRADIGSTGAPTASGRIGASPNIADDGIGALVTGTNLAGSVDLTSVTGITLEQFRFGAAVQQVYEQLARCGSRYREFCRSFFGVEADDPYRDIPSLLGHVRRKLDLYQTAQTSPSAEGSTPQANLAAFGYTATNGFLFKKRFLEHGYVHILAVVRHRNVYPALLEKDWFRVSQLDYYLPQLANLSEQPVYTEQINPFYSTEGQVFGYQEAWAEYRYDTDQVTGLMRPGVSGNLAVWNYADNFDSTLGIADAEWLKSNSEEVMNRTLAVTSSVEPQLYGQFRFKVDKELPMPVYSVPGLDIV